jgi:NAD(P)-dependent dehydrogenase (short-subunit alcohol dehydrogenase family)
MNLKDKTVVITGASSGLGKALAVALVAHGAKVVMSSNNEPELQLAFAQCFGGAQLASAQRFGGAKEVGGVPVVADVTRKEDMQKLADAAVAQFGRIDIWVNNAGINAPWSSIEDIDIERAHRMMEVNFFGTLYGSQVALRQMKKQGARLPPARLASQGEAGGSPSAQTDGGQGGVIMNVVSMASLGSRPQAAAYAASKWAARGFTESLREATKSDNIIVMAVHPGGIKTALFGDHRPPDYGTYMEPSFVAERIVENLAQGKPEEELVIRRSA